MSAPVMQFWSLEGLVSYEAARKFQHELVDLRARDLIPDTVLFLEHEPVITQGRGLQFSGYAKAAHSERHMPVPTVLPPGVAFSESERGGDLTFHGPGQLVIYPICKLDGEGFGPHHDVAGYLRKLENVLIAELRELSLPASVRKGATGVWLGDLKIASIGIAVRRWVTYHGAALNCMNDLKSFQLISPCGFAPEVMTRMLDWVPELALQSLKPGDWRHRLEAKIATRMAGSYVQVERMPLESSRVAGLTRTLDLERKEARATDVAQASFNRKSGRD